MPPDNQRSLDDEVSKTEKKKKKEIQNDDHAFSWPDEHITLIFLFLFISEDVSKCSYSE